MSKINIKNFPFDLILRKNWIALVVPILKNVQSFKKFTEGKRRNFDLILEIFTRFSREQFNTPTDVYMHFV
jgi:hypothetical protein